MKTNYVMEMEIIVKCQKGYTQQSKNIPSISMTE